MSNLCSPPVTSTFYVDGARVDSYVPTGSITEPFLTLVDAAIAAPPNSVIHIAAGTYNGNITLAQNVSLFGVGMGQTFINGTIQSDGTTIKDVTLNQTLFVEGPSVLNNVDMEGVLYCNSDLRAFNLTIDPVNGSAITINNGEVVLSDTLLKSHSDVPTIFQNGGFLSIANSRIEGDSATVEVIQSIAGSILVNASYIHSLGGADAAHIDNDAVKYPNFFINVDLKGDLICHASPTNIIAVFGGEVFGTEVIRWPSSMIGYDPDEVDDWTTVPDNVQSALDILAARKLEIQDGAERFNLAFFDEGGRLVDSNVPITFKSDITHNHNLADLTEKSYLSLTDKPNHSQIVDDEIDKHRLLEDGNLSDVNLWSAEKIWNEITDGTNHQHNLADLVERSYYSLTDRPPHSAIVDDEVVKHRVINDIGISNIELWSSSKIDSEIDVRIQTVIDAAPAALDTLNEIAASLNDDPDFAGTMVTQLTTKSDTTHNHNLADLTEKSYLSLTDKPYHSQIAEDEPEKHRLIDDINPVSTTTLWSSVKIDTTIDDRIQVALGASTITQALANKAEATHSHDHSYLNDDEPEKHRLINDVGTTAIDLWSAERILTEFTLYSTTTHSHNLADLTEKSYASLTDKPSHSEIFEDEPEKHRLIDDGLTATTALWSSSKIQSELDLKLDVAHNHNLADLDEKSYLSLTDKPSHSVITDDEPEKHRLIDDLSTTATNLWSGAKIFAHVADDTTHVHPHSTITDDEPEKHRLIDDGGQSTTVLWSSSKIVFELDLKSDITHNHNLADLTEKSYASLTDKPSHSQITDDEPEKHRLIDDAGTSITDLWSAFKIQIELDGKSDITHNHNLADLTEKSYTSLTDKPSHSQITDDEPEKHRLIDDLGTAVTDLWSAVKIQTELDLKSDTTHNHNLADLDEKSYASLTDKPNHSDINDDEIEKHRLIDDLSTAADVLWSASKIQLELDGKIDSPHNHNLADLDEKSYNSLTDKPSHSDITDDEPEKHRLIDDLGTSITDLWSAVKIQDELNTKSSVTHNHSLLNLTEKSYTSLDDKPSHSDINDDEPQKHRIINDIGNSNLELWSAYKISGEVTTLDTKIDNEVLTLDTRITTEVGTLNTRIDNEVLTLDTRITTGVGTLNTAITNLDNTKADKAIPGTPNSISLLDATGNLADSGALISDLEPVGTAAATMSTHESTHDHSRLHDRNTDNYLITPTTLRVYVDGSRVDVYTEDGTVTKPFKTVQAAIDDVTDADSTKPYVVHINPGIYEEDLVFKPWVSLCGYVKESTRIHTASGDHTGTFPTGGIMSLKNLHMGNATNGMIFNRTTGDSGLTSVWLDNVNVGNLTFNFIGGGVDYAQCRNDCIIDGNLNSHSAQFTAYNTSFAGSLYIDDVGVEHLDGYGKASSCTFKDCVGGTLFASGNTTTELFNNFSWGGLNVDGATCEVVYDVQSAPNSPFQLNTFNGGTYTRSDNAFSMSYDNTSSGMTAETVQDAVDELKEKTEVWESGNTASRPATPVAGTRYFDTDLTKPIWFSGSSWVDALGTVV